MNKRYASWQDAADKLARAGHNSRSQGTKHLIVAPETELLEILIMGSAYNFHSRRGGEPRFLDDTHRKTS